MSIISEFLSFFRNERHTQQVTATTTDSIALMWKGQGEGEQAHRQQQLAQEAELGRGG